MKSLEELVKANTIKPIMITTGEVVARATICLVHSPIARYVWIVTGPMTYRTDVFGSEAEMRAELSRYA